MGLRIKQLFLWFRKLAFKVVLSFLALSIGLVIVFKYLPILFTYTMLEQKISAMAHGSESNLKYDWKPLKGISKEMAVAVIAAEDQLFFEHNGLDFASIKKALKKNKTGRKIRGGSTISQQTAKNVFLWQNRTWLRKGLETYFTCLIEILWGKERILEVYLNVMETGPLTFGAEAAAQKYFNVSAQHISRFQACRLAAILPSPRNWKAKDPTPYISKRTFDIIHQVRLLGGTDYLKTINY